jgi:hypothetical protein
MKAAAADRLVQEVTDLLSTSSVGLYEFIWLLRSAYPNARDDELRSSAADALRRLLEEHQGRLVLLQWPSEDVLDAAPGRELSTDDWNDPVVGVPFVAITRN